MTLEAQLDDLGRELLATLRASPQEFGPEDPPAVGPPALTEAVPRLPDLVLESEAALVLGEAPARSLSLAVPVFEPFGGGTWTFGPPFAQAARGARAPCDVVQILVVQAAPPASRALLARLGSMRSLARRIPGYFAHSEGTRTGARVHRGLVARGFSQAHLAAEVRRQAGDEGFAVAAVAVGVPSARALELLAPFGARLERLRAALVAERVAAAREGCEGRECRTCDERVVCDKVRAVLADDRRTGAATGRGS